MSRIIVIKNNVTKDIRAYVIINNEMFLIQILERKNHLSKLNEDDISLFVNQWIERHEKEKESNLDPSFELVTIPGQTYISIPKSFFERMNEKIEKFFSKNKVVEESV